LAAGQAYVVKRGQRSRIRVMGVGFAAGQAITEKSIKYKGKVYYQTRPLGLYETPLGRGGYLILGRLRMDDFISLLLLR
jgi:hypothetical protein